MIKIKKGIPLIDQHDKNGFWGGKFGGSYIPETLKKPIDDLTIQFEKLRRNKSFLREKEYYYNNWVHRGPTPFIKLKNLTKYLGGAQIYAKVVSEARGGAHKNIWSYYCSYAVQTNGKKIFSNRYRGWL